jgi:hypothetical protein
MVAPTRFELVTPDLSGLCSTTELRGNIHYLEDTLRSLQILPLFVLQVECIIKIMVSRIGFEPMT